MLPALLALAACDGGTLPGTDPIHGQWATPVSMFHPNLDIDRAEHRYTFFPNGTFESTTLAYQNESLGLRAVYENRMKGEYRLGADGFAINPQSYRWREAGMSRWQDEVVSDDGGFGPPTRYTINGDRLIVHYGPSRGEHDEPIPARDQVYTRRR